MQNGGGDYVDARDREHPDRSDLSLGCFDDAVSISVELILVQPIEANDAADPLYRSESWVDPVVELNIILFAFVVLFHLRPVGRVHVDDYEWFGFAPIQIRWVLLVIPDRRFVVFVSPNVIFKEYRRFFSFYLLVVRDVVPESIPICSPLLLSFFIGLAVLLRSKLVHETK